VYFYVVYFLLGKSRRLYITSRRFGTLYRFHLHRQVDEEWLGMGYVVYIYIYIYPKGVVTGKWQSQWEGELLGEVGGCTTGCGGGRYIRACGGGITVVYSAAVSYSSVYIVVVSRTC
jgi:hypothetical protein